MNEISVLNAEQKEQETKLIQNIRDAVNASFEVVARSLIEVKENNLWVEFESLNDWALEHFKFTAREVDYYITGYAVTKRLEGVDNGGKPIKLTHALTVNKFDENDQVAVYTEAVRIAEESDGKLTGELIRETGREMLERGEVKLRSGVNRLGNTGNNSLVTRFIRALPTLKDEDQARIFSEWVKATPPSFLFVMKTLVEDQITKNDSE